LGGAVLLAALRFPAQPIDGLAAGGREEPRPGAVRHAAGGPRPERGDGGFLEGILGEVEVAEDADQGGEDLSRLPTEQVVKLRRQRGT